MQQHQLGCPGRWRQYRTPQESESMGETRGADELCVMSDFEVLPLTIDFFGPQETPPPTSHTGKWDAARASGKESTMHVAAASRFSRPTPAIMRCIRCTQPVPFACASTPILAPPGPSSPRYITHQTQQREGAGLLSISSLFARNILTLPTRTALVCPS